ncbi:SRPBCC domain-containing protein [Luteimicrobium subarcticum]|uniref:Activator of Hsp90 ATPase-like protein n=1 Tax=Luteimicrobium subarcticum TaxID=620910 RepID=A0A2M8WJ56_9MICO|nr:SRPBCC domain-containing protein [Luteimicrobium subarcticum]PJI90928.1 activator of Hsp90 ATPase-like protein [Luteimicrobium subarcticum]
MSDDAPNPTPDDLTAQIGSVARTVDVRTVDGALQDEVVLAQSFAADLDTVWQAVSRTDRITQWFLPVTGELVDGGRYAVEGNASGTVLDCRAPHRFEVTWEFAGEVTWVTVELAREGEDGPLEVGPADPPVVGDAGTRLTLVHRLPRAPQWESFGPAAVGIGWDSALLGLARHLAAGSTGGRLAPEWVQSTGGLDFLEASGRAWGHAHAASGVADDVAHAAAGRTVAAYTGRPVE